jgi:hypothetical protein
MIGMIDVIKDLCNGYNGITTILVLKILSYLTIIINHIGNRFERKIFRSQHKCIQEKKTPFRRIQIYAW